MPAKPTATATAIALAGVLATGLSAAAGAGSLVPLQGATFELNDWAVSVYYTDQGDNYEVVTTLAALEGGMQVPIRFTTALAPGQRASVVVGSFDAVHAPAGLEIERTGDEVSATLAPLATGAVPVH